MKSFIFGFLAAYFIFTIAIQVKNAISDSGQSQSGYTTPSQVAQDMENLFKDKQNKSIIFLAKSTPTLTDFAQGDIVFSTPTQKGWTRIQNDRYYFNLTKF